MLSFIYSCTRCLHFNYGKRFCENCGAKLGDPA
jgi:hypothetical protein